MSNYWDELMGTDEGAASYMESYGEGPGSETRHMIGALINDGETVLDVGCGPGWNYDHFMEFGPKIKKYLGMDYSKRFVRVANKRMAEKYGGRHFVVGDVRDIKQPDESWDVVLLQDVLEHTNGYEKPVKEALRIAKKRVIVSFWRAMRDEGSGDQINDDGNDGYGATYEKIKWEKFLDSLGYKWTFLTTSPESNRHHLFYIINKEERRQ